MDDVSKIEPQVEGSMDQDEQSDKPPADQLVVVKVEAHRWMVGTLLFACLFVVAMFGWLKAVEDRANDVKTALIKITPEGHSYIEFHDNDAPLAVWPAVINSKLEAAFTRRYTEDPRTVANDYTFFSHFLSREQYNQFLAADEFSALEKIKRIESSPKQSPIVIPRMSVMHHMDAEKINVNALTGEELITSQLFFDFEYRSKKTGLLISKEGVKKKIVTARWRINPMKLKRASYGSDEEFRAAIYENPIGLELLSYGLADVAEGVR